LRCDAAVSYLDPRHCSSCSSSSVVVSCFFCVAFFFFTHTAPPEIYTLSLHDALPISAAAIRFSRPQPRLHARLHLHGQRPRRCKDRKSTRLNSSHEWISYAVFCLKKKKNKK